MDEPGSFTSLMAMVESHLSKTSLSSSPISNGQAGSSFSLPNICSVRNNNSESLLPPPSTVLQLPRFEVKNSEITEILAHQVKNMLKTQEKEKQRLGTQFNKAKLKDENDDYMIDLSSSIIQPGSSQCLTKFEVKTSTLSNASSIESLHSEDEQSISIKPTEPTNKLLPTCEDISYILFQKIKKGKCSAFGKVLTARLRPVAAPYLRTIVTHPDVIPFDFSTPSPCDINKEKRLQPPTDPYAHMNMVDRFMAMNKD